MKKHLFIASLLLCTAYVVQAYAVDRQGEEMSDTSCSKDKWSKYEFGDYYQRLSEQYELSPYDLAFGDKYSKRHIPKEVQVNILENMMKYIRYFSSAELSRYEENNEKVFNQIVKKDNACYQKLK